MLRDKRICEEAAKSANRPLKAAYEVSSIPTNTELALRIRAWLLQQHYFAANAMPCHLLLQMQCH